MTKEYLLPRSALPAPRFNKPVIPHGRLGLILLLGSETILFSTFIGAYIVLRIASPVWPPAGTPRLQLGLSLFNSAVLVASTVTAFLARRAAQAGIGIV